VATRSNEKAVEAAPGRRVSQQSRRGPRGWTREECKKFGVKYVYFRSLRENDRYPHYIHSRDSFATVVVYSA